MTNIDANADTVDQRLAALVKAREVFPDVDADRLMEIVAWVLTGAVPLDSVALERAAKTLAVDAGMDWGHRPNRNTYRGLAAATISAYLRSEQS
jgi:hypothetical protein